MTGILSPIYDAVSWVMIAFHRVFTAVGLPGDSGVTWGLSIVGLVVLIRILLIPLFVKQIKAQRGLQALQPQMKALQQKYKNDRQKLSEETMKLYKETGTNPLSSCLPLLVQSPFFFSLFHVLNEVSRNPDNPPGVFTRSLAESASNATLFGAPLSETFLGNGTVSTKAVLAILVVAMSLTMFLTQRQLMLKNMPADSLQGNPFAQQQKILLYVMPGIFLVSGLGFPLGVLLYWLTNNLWTGAQQYYVIKRNPTPGSRAAIELEERRARQGKSTVTNDAAPRPLLSRLRRKPTTPAAPAEPTAGRRPTSPPPGGGANPGSGSTAAETASPSGQRQQPRRQPKRKR
ncbi:MAG: membrane protein insertase YidC [Actinomycetes bacterium]